MTGEERKRAFKSAAAAEGLTLAGAAHEVCGVTWEHLSSGIANPEARPISIEVKQKFAEYIGKTVEEVFGSDDSVAA